MLFVLFIANIASFGLIGYRNPDLYLQLKAICQGPYTAVLMPEHEENKQPRIIENLNEVKGSQQDLGRAITGLEADVCDLYDRSAERTGDLEQRVQMIERLFYLTLLISLSHISLHIFFATRQEGRLA